MIKRQQRSSDLPEHGAIILVINSGSSSVKFALFAAEKLSRLWSGAIERIGLEDGRFYAVDSVGARVLDETKIIDDHKTALKLLLDAIEQSPSLAGLVSVGHRVVHGGPECDCPILVTPAVEARLRALIPLAPLHQPHNLAGIVAARTVRPNLPQFACFDTSFHSTLPRLAKLTALPRKLYDEGIRRYGFHGLSYEFIISELHRRRVDLEHELIIIAHLGNGASMVALKAGQSVETTMGFSTLSGLPMGTRCGDLDPGIILYLLAERKMSVEQVQHMLYESSGLLGVSGLTPSMEDLLEQRSKEGAAEAVEFYCYQARRQLAALTATLGGLDRVVFTGGIGANAPLVRAKICADLTYLGIVLDPNRNVEGAELISDQTSRVTVNALATDEELMIAQHVRHLSTA